MNIGLAGLPMSGKTTVFNMATCANAKVRDFIAQSDEVNTGIIKVPDNRIDNLTEIFKPRKTIYATIQFTDIPGVSADESGFSSKTLSKIRISDALIVVIRLFPSDEIPHIHDKVDPAADIEEIALQFILADLEIVQNKIERVQKEMKSGKKPQQIKEMELMERLAKALESNQFISELEISEEEEGLLRGFRFLTQKPVLAVGNGSDLQFTDASGTLVKSFIEACGKRKWMYMTVSGKTEMEISVLSPEEEAIFLEEYGISEPARQKLIKTAYQMLDYISFLTVGEDEVRAWPIKNGISAQKAAGKVHSDIERGFIRAEVVSYDDFMSQKTMAGVKQAGLARLEGKEYPVKDGDIINFRFNV